MKIAAFNIQKFGKKKLSDPAIVKTLIKVKIDASDMRVTCFPFDF